MKNRTLEWESERYFDYRTAKPIIYAYHIHSLNSVSTLSPATETTKSSAKCWELVLEIALKLCGRHWAIPLHFTMKILFQMCELYTTAGHAGNKNVSIN